MLARELTIDGVRISDDSDCYVIAEIGENHLGSVTRCKEIFDAAKLAGAHAVTLQQRSLGGPRQRAGASDRRSSAVADFSREQLTDLAAYARAIGITLFATPWDFETADMLHRLGMPAFKIGSQDLRTIPLLKHVASFGKPMILQTGGATLEDVERAYCDIMPINPQLCILQMTLGRPPKPEEMNLNVIKTFRELYPDVVVGLAAHDTDTSMPLIGYMLGMRVVEKLFTLSRDEEGDDQPFALEPLDLRELIEQLHYARQVGS